MVQLGHGESNPDLPLLIHSNWNWRGGEPYTISEISGIFLPDQHNIIFKPAGNCRFGLVQTAAITNVDLDNRRWE
jgi:hypothetical protein